MDAIRAYHGGERVVVEAEVVMAPETTLRESHDACLLLQQDLESMDEVERAFVHADYAKRAAPEHAGDASRATEARIRHRARSRRKEASGLGFVRFLGGWFSRRRGKSPSRESSPGRVASLPSSIGDELTEARPTIPDARRERHVCPSQEGHRRLGSNVALTCEEGEGPAFDTIGAPLLPER